MPVVNFYAERTASTYGFSSNNDAKRKNNALAIFLSLTRLYGWSENSAYATIGNINGEGCMNPLQWQVNSSGTEVASNGFGLVQWTPSYKLVTRLSELGITVDDVNNTTGAQQCKAIDHDCRNNIQWGARSSYNNMTGEQYIKSTESIEYLTGAWLRCYERPAVQSDAVVATRYEYALLYKAYIESVLATETDADPYTVPTVGGEVITPEEPETPVAPSENGIVISPKATNGKVGSVFQVTVAVGGDININDVNWDYNTRCLQLMSRNDNVVMFRVLPYSATVGGAYYTAYWSQDATISDNGYISISKQRKKSKWMIYNNKII